MRLGARSIPIEYYILRIARPATPKSSADNAVVGYLAERPIFAMVADSAGIRCRYVGFARDCPTDVMACNRSPRASGSSSRASFTARKTDVPASTFN
jgi:hypothetical protein